MKKRVAILLTHGFEEIEMTSPKKALEDEGFLVDLVSPEKDNIKAWKGKNWSGEYPVDKSVDKASSQDYTALMLPGGVMNPDYLRRSEESLRFVQEFIDQGKPVAAICHAPWVLISADVVKGKKITSFPSLRVDLENAGANWVDQEVVVDGGLVTSRNPDDLDAFNAKLVEAVNNA